MSNLLQFPDPRKVMREASAWIVSIEEGLTDEERRELEAWLAADPRHPKALVELANVWDGFDALSELARIFPLEQYRPRRVKGRRSRLKPLLQGAAVAAAVGCAAVVGWYVWPRALAPETPEPIRVALPEVRGNDGQNAAADGAGSPQRSYETAVGEQLSARLPDGSVVTLNTDTQLDVDYSGAERRVAIRRGEASFNVMPDAARPFRVLAGDTVVQAVGTIFNVQLASTDRIEVTVSEGRVRVTSAETEPLEPAQAPDARRVERGGVDMTVGAGELAVIDGPEEAVRRIDPLEIEAKLAWQQGMLIFRGAPLESVLADVSRYTTVKFTIADDSIRSTRVGGYFRAGDIDALLLALRESFGIEPRRVGDEIFLTARE